MPSKAANGRPYPARDTRKAPVEKLVERVFIKKPRILSFSHRSAGSLRHPYAQLVYEASLGATARGDRLTYILEAFLDAKKEKTHWQRVERIFDSKLGDEHMEKMKLDLLFSPELLQCLEVLWSRVGGVSGGFMTEDAYRQFQQQLYFMLLDINDIGLVPATMQFIQEDIHTDCKSEAGLDFAGFATSILELADNWTPTRCIPDYVAFVRKITEAFTPEAKQTIEFTNEDDFRLNQDTFFIGGVIKPVQVNGETIYRRTTI
ncbi:putative mitochondrial hypothetical protein [Leptomonas pyrrhocoris]|uniref:Uncharacterized protein n=1 Tax=Leptomonas pyrrhocoris TaxID=157538 RepID=A0A0M9G7X5_LEPPY|nr:putative mitochondrial hypothetical protein [Leptomonas pyrrhocoris]XP_015662990.1 putative mitochondrial hypothetical protein [Leptomonas pyrrhocoris]KPA84550.1 putative mitochondrial hypothetical protein [Leptomonas pyrrhocoris]KPA84551.1 putative mitochondrial hypothetical protein [Leptomonas pyrrhocoris]|eukprot:XP_015662989.1 putative mitochondrial hypothetical protein [Leptomonas pyrrhocoris]